MSDSLQEWHGACAYLDVLGFRAISRAYRNAPHAPIARLRHIAKVAELADGSFDFRFNLDRHSLDSDSRCLVVSDGIFVFAGVHPKGSLDDMPGGIEGLAVELVARVVCRILEASVKPLSPDAPTFVYRGAIAVGNYYEDGQRFVVGDAAFDAVASEGLTPNPCVWLTPSALEAIEKNSPNISGAIWHGGGSPLVDYDVELKSGGKLRTQVVNPLAGIIPAGEQRMSERFLTAFGTSLSAEVAAKKQWFLRFLDHCRNAPRPQSGKGTVDIPDGPGENSDP